MKNQYVSAALLVGLAMVSVSHCRFAHALTYEETACIAQMYLDGKDPTGCFNLGGDGGGAGSGGSGSAAGSMGTGNGLTGGPEIPKDCSAPGFFFTGAPDPRLVANASYFGEQPGIGKSTETAFVAGVDGHTYLYNFKASQFYDVDTGAYTGASYKWTRTEIDSSGDAIGSLQVSQCQEGA